MKVLHIYERSEPILVLRQYLPSLNVNNLSMYREVIVGTNVNSIAMYVYVTSKTEAIGVRSSSVVLYLFGRICTVT